MPRILILRDQAAALAAFMSDEKHVVVALNEPHFPQGDIAFTSWGGPDHADEQRHVITVAGQVRTDGEVAA